MSFWNLKTEKSKALEIIKEYVNETGNTDFTYNDLRSWYYGSGAYQRYKRDWHTIERLLRKLAEEGILLRYRWRRTVRFVVPSKPTNAFLIKDIHDRYKEALFNRDYDKVNQIVREFAEKTGITIENGYRILSHYVE